MVVVAVVVVAAVAIGGAAITGMIVAAIVALISEAKERSKQSAHGMPKPPRGRSQDYMKRAAQKIKLDYKNYNFGFCGTQGTGKSTLINSLRHLEDVPMPENWTHSSILAAPTGEKETTMKLNSYKWPPQHEDRCDYVRLWDIPGCGTIKHPTKTYFYEKYLYALDCLVVVTSGNLGEYELQIINDAGMCERPVVVVLSKSELKAESKARRDCKTTELTIEAYKPIVENTINEAKSNMRETIDKAKSKYKSINISEVFVVSAVKYRDVYNTRNEMDGLLSFETSKLLLFLLEEGRKRRIN